jgi:hypothetical protein
MRSRGLWSLFLVAGSVAMITLSFTARELRVDLVQGDGRDFTDFPFAIDHQGQQLAGLLPKEEPKAADNPIGLAEAAKILKDSDMFEKSKGSDAMDSWKAAVKNSGPAIIQDVTDDATSFNPFPKSSLSEKMEIQDVWDKAQALAKPAGPEGSLDGDAKTAKKTIENAESQADASAYLAANEVNVAKPSRCFTSLVPKCVRQHFSISFLTLSVCKWCNTIYPPSARDPSGGRCGRL